jgi:hypothetical protein
VDARASDTVVADVDADFDEPGTDADRADADPSAGDDEAMAEEVDAVEGAADDVKPRDEEFGDNDGTRPPAGQA